MTFFNFYLLSFHKLNLKFVKIWNEHKNEWIYRKWEQLCNSNEEDLFIGLFDLKSEFKTKKTGKDMKSVEAIEPQTKAHGVLMTHWKSAFFTVQISWD